MKNRIFKGVWVLAAAIAMVSCENRPIEFDDFGEVACYFPYQTPARTLILGNYDLGFNDNDNDHKFEIGLTITGVYENEIDREVYFELDESLLSGVTNVKALPKEYYTIETSSPVTIPAGSIKGRIQVQLTEDFFNDSLAVAPRNTTNYAIPLVITDADESIDKILFGAPLVSNPNPLVLADWEADTIPKYYTVFGIKYINKYEGIYLRRGEDMLDTLGGTVPEYGYAGSTYYHDDYVERDETVKAYTKDLNTLLVSNRIRRMDKADGGIINLSLVFADDESCTIYNADTDEQIGLGSFVEEGDAWGGSPRDVIYLNYAYDDAGNSEKHQVYDTLVIRNRDVIFETFEVTF